MSRKYCITIVALIVLTMFGCHQEPATISATEERVFVVNIVPDSVKLKEYLDYHEKVWPEVEGGFKKAGYKGIVLYRYGHLVVMTITVPAGADLDQMGKLAESYDPRCAEWNQLMNGYQTGVAGTKQGQTWVEVRPFYRFSNP